MKRFQRPLRGITAEFVNGVLEIASPVAAVALPKKIEIKTVPLTKQAAA